MYTMDFPWQKVVLWFRIDDSCRALAAARLVALRSTPPGAVQWGRHWDLWGG